MHSSQSSSRMAASLIIAFIITFQSALLSAAFTSPHHHHTSTSSLAVGLQRQRPAAAPCTRDAKSKSAGLDNFYRSCNTLHHYRNSCALNLVPISEAWDTNTNNNEQQSFASLLPSLGCDSFNSEGMLIHSDDNKENKRYRLYLATDVDDLPPIASLTIDVFDATAITISSTSDWSALEQAMVGAFVNPVLGAYNAYAQAVGFTEVLSGLRKRMRNRISNHGNYEVEYDWLAPLVVPEANDTSNEKETTLEDIAARSSLILALARHHSEGEEEDNMEVVASVELRLQPTDAKIPFSQPWLDKLERRLVRLIPFVKDESTTSMVATNKDATFNDGTTKVVGTTGKGKSKSPPLRPYLCNLCVSPSLRSLGIGRALCRILEAIAQEKWGYNHMYLHVDPTNDAARGLYEKEGYVDVGRRWSVIWADGAEGISYYVKKLGR